MKWGSPSVQLVTDGSDSGSRCFNSFGSIWDSMTLINPITAPCGCWDSLCLTVLEVSVSPRVTPATCSVWMSSLQLRAGPVTLE